MVDGRWSMVDGRWSMVDGRWSMVDGRWSMVDGRLKVPFSQTTQNSSLKTILITLFRRIRQKLIDAGAITKYLLYTIGEIMLVVIGILIALQVNNWNQQTYERNLEEKYIQELLQDFNENMGNADRVLRLLDTALPKLIALLEQSALEAPNVPVDSLNNWFRVVNEMPTYRSTDRAYTNITGSGELKIISSDEIKYAIARYYSYLEVTKIVQNTHELELVETFQPYIIENLDFQAVNFERVGDYTLPAAVDEDAILSVLHTQHFRNIITTKWTIMTDLLNQYREIRPLIAEVILVLEDEVE